MDINIKTLNNNRYLLPNVKKFLFKQIKNEFGFDYVPDWHQDIVKLEEYYINPKNSNFFVALNGDEIIASIGIRQYDKHFEAFKNIYIGDKTASIWRLFVDSRYRRCGLASVMFGICEDFAKKVNYENIYLHTHKNLDGALKFWMKMGFYITIDDNDELQTVHMEKFIQNFDTMQIESIFNYAIEF